MTSCDSYSTIYYSLIVAGAAACLLYLSSPSALQFLAGCMAAYKRVHF